MFFVVIILICSLTTREVKADCDEQRQLETTCGRYCFKIVKPLLDHAKGMGNKFCSSDDEPSSSTDSRFVAIEQMLLEQKVVLRELRRQQNPPSRTPTRSFQQNDSYDESNFELQIGNKHYHVESNYTANWHEAAHLCRKLGGNLLNIESSVEMDALLAAIPSDRYWTSANCLSDHRNFISIATGEALTYARWNTGEPNNAFGDEYCGELDQGTLNDNSCFRLRKYICEAKIVKKFDIV